MPPLTRRHRWTFGLLTLALALFSLARFDGPARGYWDTYITVPAMFMTGHAVDLRRMDGTPRFFYQLRGRLPDDTYDPTPGSYGIASKDQRIGTAIAFAAPFSLLNLSAFRVGYALTWVVAFGFGFVALRRLLGGFSWPLAGALVLVLNPFSLYLDRLNGNLFGLAGLTFLWVLATEERPRWWLVGLVYGVLGGIRNEAIVLGPVMLALLWQGSGGRRRAFAGHLAAFTAAAFAAILPVLVWNDFAYGQPIIHPSQVAHLEGFRPTFPHTFLGHTFAFNGLLNWPFHDHWVRTPHFAFPTVMLWPLLTIRVLGVGLAALGLIGVVALVHARRFEGWALLAWYLLVFALFVPQENWEELKQTFMALHLLPLAAFVAAGLAWLAAGVRQPRRWGLVAAVAAAIAAAVWGAGAVDLPADERWYVRFPHAGRNDSGLDALPERLRKDWHFFYTHETEAEIAAERQKLATPHLLPRLYRPFTAPPADLARRLVGEPTTDTLQTLAIWSYIYE
ncbi:MAG: hypothetical protein ABIO70_09050 [Pseudomonadota bacterium]